MTKLINSWPKLKTEAILAKAILTRNTRIVPAGYYDKVSMEFDLQCGFGLVLCFHLYGNADVSSQTPLKSHCWKHTNKLTVFASWQNSFIYLYEHWSDSDLDKRNSS